MAWQHLANLEAGKRRHFTPMKGIFPLGLRKVLASGSEWKSGLWVVSASLPTSAIGGLEIPQI